MPLLNYTTSIAPQKTVMEIQSALAKAGASRIMTEMDRDGQGWTDCSTKFRTTESRN